MISYEALWFLMPVVTLCDIEEVAVPDHVTFLDQVTYSGNLVQTELPIERKPNQIAFG